MLEVLTCTIQSDILWLRAFVFRLAYPLRVFRICFRSCSFLAPLLRISVGISLVELCTDCQAAVGFTSYDAFYLHTYDWTLGQTAH